MCDSLCDISRVIFRKYYDDREDKKETGKYFSTFNRTSIEFVFASDIQTGEGVRLASGNRKEHSNTAEKKIQRENNEVPTGGGDSRGGDCIYSACLNASSLSSLFSACFAS